MKYVPFIPSGRLAVERGQVINHFRGGIECSFRLRGGVSIEMPAFSATMEGALVSAIMKPTPSRQDIESARRKMLDARQALEDHENSKGHAASPEHQRLSNSFRKATQEYLNLSRTQN